MKWKPVLKKNYHQLIFVFIAFLLMILVSIVSVTAITQQKLRSASNEALHTVEANIKMNLQEPEATLVGAIFTVQNMVVHQEASSDEVLQYLIGLTDWLLENEERVSGFNGIYGLIRGDYLDGMSWVPPAGYIPQNRPWYTKAAEHPGEIVMTDPYIDAQTQVVVISLAQEIPNPEGEPVGVISLDIMLTRLTEYVSSLQQSYGGYGILLDGGLSVIAHPERTFAGTPLESLSEDFAAAAAELRAGSDISGKIIRDADGTRMILFLRKLYNGWYVGMLTPLDTYYSELYSMGAILIAMGIVLMVALSLILMRLAAAKMRSDEENRSKSSFLARMSHEIRTPMNAILGMVELILRSDLPGGVREEVIAIKQAGANLLSIIGDILDFSKIESGRMELVSAQYRLMSLLSDTINIVRMRVGEKPVLFVVNIDSRLPDTLIGDEVRLRQVLLNLLSNATKYTREGSVALTVNGLAEDGDTLTLSFEVSDTGIGIQEEDLHRLFGDFTQLDTQKNVGIEGTGLGLAIARSLCRMMGGDIAVSSKYGRGSVFTARVPQKIASRTPLASVHAPQEHSILLYEPREAYAASILRSVQNLGVPCLRVTDRAGCADALRRIPCSFVFTAPGLYESVRGAISESGSKAEPILLTEFNEAAPPAGVRALSLPVYCTPIADLLNGVSDAGAGIRGEAEGLSVRFTAPEARILIVDDVEVNLLVAEGMLAPYGAQIDCASGGKEAIELVQKNHYDLIFMDHMMPEPDGIETVKQIRALGGAYQRTLPIAALTANAISGMREMFLANGFDDYLAKPIEMQELNAVVHRWIPPEKRVEAGIAAPCAAGCTASELQISGLDTERGLMMASGSEKNYREVLGLFCRDATSRLGLLGELPNEKSLSQFTAQVHALKSALASIGAAELSGQAAFLEQAGQGGDLDAFRRFLGTFQPELAALVQRIRAALDSPASAPAAAAANTAVLRRLKDALEEEHIGRMNALLDELSEQPGNGNTEAAVQRLSECILVSDFEGAVCIIDHLLRGD